MILLEIVLVALAFIAMVPGLVFGIECVASVVPARRVPRVGPSSRGRVVVVVPAHDEAPIIGATLAHLRRHLREGDGLLVVADNCTDRTAELARSAGADVLERHDPERRGKGYALSHAFDALAEDPPDVVVVVDADCRLSPGSLDALAGDAMARGCPVQAEYLLSPSDEHPRSAISALAFLVRNRVRPRGLARLGLPCHLAGSGMAFPWAALAGVPPTGCHLVEDLLLGIELAERGLPPRPCLRARVTSVLPSDADAALAQRRRWEHGQLGIALARGPRLLLAGRLDLLAMGLDLLVPPLALLVLVQLLVLAVAGTARAAGASSTPLILASIGLLAVVVGVGVAVLGHGRGTTRLRALAAAPAYVLWKVPLYVAFALRRGQRSWQRTRRRAEEDR
ncbi:MAG: glycosyltransferase family 2 protein [Myxococcota bacterium]